MKLGTLTLGDTPSIIISVLDQESNEAIQAASIAALEIRVDLFSSFDIDYINSQLSLRRELQLPLLLTVRNSELEGGKSDISDAHKLTIFESVITSVDAVDIELRSPLVEKVIDLAKKNSKVCLLSFHDFKETPQDDVLDKILKDAKSKGADIVKIATQANSEEDVERLKAFTSRNRDQNIITMSLGKIGSISRITFPSVGSLLTYSYLTESFAPGQVPLDVLKERLKRQDTK